MRWSSGDKYEAAELMTPLIAVLSPAFLTGHSIAKEAWPAFPKNGRILFQDDSITDGNRGRNE
jgi:hypothetical protein